MAGDDRRWWVAAYACMVGLCCWLPAYFARANRALLAADSPADDVPEELATWNRWNWLRTALSLLATALGLAAVRSRHDRARPPSTRMLTEVATAL